jgi:3-phenylpropionate/cinnamic acid dioxygenase small subunit
MTLPYETQHEIELFLLREAKLLDTGEFEAWLALYAPQGIYWMPSQPGQMDPKGAPPLSMRIMPSWPFACGAFSRRARLF